MSIYAFKPKFQALLRPLSQRLYDKGITANQVTLFACGLSILWSLTGWIWQPLFLVGLPLLMLVRMALNAIDGMLAREFGQKSPLGGYLNEITDVVADSFLYAPFALLLSSVLVVVLLLLAMLTEFCGLLGVAHGNGRHYEGPMGKSDRAFWFSALALLILYLGEVPQWLYYTAWLFVPLLIWTCYNRVKQGLKGE